MSKLWPRKEADKILLLKTKEERTEALKMVPKEFREWVKHLVVDYYDKRRNAHKRRR